MYVRQLKEYIQNTGLKQTFLASKVGISTPHLSQVLNERRNMTTEVYFRILRALGITEDEIKDL